MTLFTEGRLQAFERMMQDTGKYHRREDSEDRPRKCLKKKAEPAKKDGEHHAGIQGWEEQQLHNDVQLPPAGSGSQPERERTSLHAAQFARHMELFGTGVIFDYAGWRRWSA